MSTPVGDFRDFSVAAGTGAASGSTAESYPERVQPQSQRVSSAAERPFRLRPGPILVVIFLALSFRFLPPLTVDLLSDYVRLPVHGARLPFYFADHLVMLLVALGLIALARRRSNIDFGLHMPLGRSYVATAIVLSFLFGVVMALVDYAPYIIRGIAPPLDDPFSGINVTGWMLYQGLYSGPTEEIPFRALLVTYLASTMPGKVHYGRLSMNGAGVVVAVLFAIGTATTALIASPLLVAISQILYVFLLGLCLAYWLEKSRSVLAPAIGHNVAFGVKQALLFALVAALR